MFRTAPRTGAATSCRGGRSRQIDDATGYVCILVEVVARAYSVIAVGDEEREPLIRLAPDEQDGRQALAGRHLLQICGDMRVVPREQAQPARTQQILCFAVELLDALQPLDERARR